MIVDIIRKLVWAETWPVLLIGLTAGIWGYTNLANGGCGATWDEPTYAVAGAYYLGLIEAEPGQTRWRLNHEHPPLAKIIMGLGEIGWLAGSGDRAGFLLGARAGVGCLAGLMFVGLWFLARPLGRWSAGLAVLLAAGCPRLLGHGLLATLDMPLTCFWIWTLVAFQWAWKPRAPEASLGWLAAWFWPGLALGLAFLTKFTAILLPGVFLVWLAGGRWGLPATETDLRTASGRQIGGHWLLVNLSGLGMLALWPWLWADLGRRLVNYLAWSFQHKMAPVLYLGKIYGATFGTDAPPWHYAPVMLLATWPLAVTLGLGVGLGFWRTGWWRRGPIWLAVVGGAALPLATILPGSVAYDGVRLFLPAVPLFCVPAAAAWMAGAEWVASRWSWGDKSLTWSKLCGLLVAGALALAGQFGISDNLSYYSPLIGGPAGAKKLGLESAYWATTLDRAELADFRRQLRQRYSTDEPRLQLVGCGERMGQFLSFCGWLPEKAVFVSDQSWQAAIIMNRRGLRAAEEFSGLRQSIEHGEKPKGAGKIHDFRSPTVYGIKSEAPVWVIYR